MSTKESCGIVVSVDKDGVRSAVIPFIGQKMRVACDGRCDKAWGMNVRPRTYLSDNDRDNFCYVPDNELGQAPADPGTYEYSDGKPTSNEEFPNKWCVRECERCYKSSPGQWHIDVKVGNLPDFSKKG